MQRYNTTQNNRNTIWYLYIYDGKEEEEEEKTFPSTTERDDIVLNNISLKTS